jgi:hypothetical protein
MTIIKVFPPRNVLGDPVAVSVETPLAESNRVFFTYIAGMAIKFFSGLLTGVEDDRCFWSGWEALCRYW